MLVFLKISGSGSSKKLVLNGFCRNPERGFRANKSNGFPPLKERVFRANKSNGFSPLRETGFAPLCKSGVFGLK